MSAVGCFGPWCNVMFVLITVWIESKGQFMGIFIKYNLRVIKFSYNVNKVLQVSEGMACKKNFTIFKQQEWNLKSYFVAKFNWGFWVQTIPIRKHSIMLS